MILREGTDLKSIQGTMFEHEDILDKSWTNIRNYDAVTLILDEGASSAALALKVWPDLAKHIERIIYAGGTLKRGDSTPYAEKTVYKDPMAAESILNAGIEIVFALKETASACGMSTKELAEKYAAHPEMFETCRCGIHIEIEKNAVTYGKMICDHLSDKKFEKKNAAYIIV